MHDYPTVPNVFRVASSHSINSMGLNAAQPGGNMQPGNNLLIYNKNSSYEQQQQQLQMQMQLKLQPKALAEQLGKHQLTTCAFIEEPQHALQQQQQQSPYATLPRRQYTQQQQMQQMHASNVISTISGSIPATGYASVSVASSYSDLQLNNLQLNNMQQANNNNNTIQYRQQEQQLEQHNEEQQHLMQQQQQQLRHQQQQHQLQHHVSFEEPEIERQQEQAQQQQQEQQEQQLNAEENADEGESSPEQSGLSTLTNVYLWLLTPVAACISVAIVMAALAGPQWLFTEEKLPNANYNGTANFNALDDGAYITKHTKSSLWLMCITMPGLGADSHKCIQIDSFSGEIYESDPHDSTTAIPYTVSKACPFFLAAGVSLVFSFLIYLIPTCSRQNSLFYFSSGILFIVSGLLMLIGLIAYISILKAEIGSKLRPRSSLQPPLFKVIYGQSFFMFVVGFVITELVGVLNIFLFINLQESSYYNRMTCFSLANIRANLKQRRIRHALGQTYRRYRQPAAATSSDTVALPLDEMHPPTQQQQQEQQPQQQQPQQQQPQQQQPQQQKARLSALRSSNLRTQQVHDATQRPMQSHTLPAGYAYRKIPNVDDFGDSNLNMFLYNDLDRRFFFEKPTVYKCNLQSRSLAKSLNELCVEPDLPVRSFEPLPPPATFADLPQEFPLTRSISTATDINAKASEMSNVHRKQQRNMATNTKVLKLEEDDELPADRLCGLKRGLRKTKDELFQEFCKRAGMRNKPKNIYYIPSEEEEAASCSIGPQITRTRPEESKEVKRIGEVRKELNDDKDGDENGFRKFRAIMDDDQLYVVGDHAHLMVPNRDSICMDAILSPLPQQQMRRLNSNLSLHTPQAEIWPWPSQPRLATEHGQSRTLPRCLLRPTMGSQDSLGSQQSIYSNNQQRFGQLMLQQQQLQKNNRFLSTLTLPRGEDPQPKAPVQWPQAIPSSPSNYANVYRRPNLQQLYAPTMPIPMSQMSQMPVPVQMPMKLPVPVPLQIQMPLQLPQPKPLQIPVQRSGPVSNNAAAQPPKIQRAYAFDETQRRVSFSNTDALDLDEMERERRRSQASLYGTIVVPQTLEQYDLINGTAV